MVDLTQGFAAGLRQLMTQIGATSQADFSRVTPWAFGVFVADPLGAVGGNSALVAELRVGGFLSTRARAVVIWLVNLPLRPWRGDHGDRGGATRLPVVPPALLATGIERLAPNVAAELDQTTKRSAMRG